MVRIFQISLNRATFMVRCSEGEREMSFKLGSTAKATLAGWAAGLVVVTWATFLLEMTTWVLPVYTLLGLPIVLLVQLARYQLHSRSSRRRHLRT